MPAWAGSSFLAAPQLWPVLGWAGNEIAVSGVRGGSCSHSLRPAHSSVRLIGPEWRHKRPPTDTLRLVIKLQAFVLLSVAFAPSLPACLGSSPPPTQPTLPWGQPINPEGPWPGATTPDEAKRLRPPGSPNRLAFLPWPWDCHSSGWPQSDLTLCSGFPIL